MSELDDLIYNLAVANRILGHEGVVDSFGHVSVRHPERPECFLLSRSRAPNMVTREDILVFGPDGEPVMDNGPAPYNERYIHAAIFNARPDVHAVVHSHAEPLLPFGITDTKLQPVFHMGARIGEDIPLWDIRDRFGDTNLLVVNMDQGNDLAAALGGNRMVLMRGHGNAVAAATLEATVMTAYYAMVNARVQTMSMMMAFAQGKGMDALMPLSSGEIAAATKSGNKGTIGITRSWEGLAGRANLGGI